MSDWGGAGLPPPAIARLERARSSGVRSSLLAVAGQAGADACGLEAVGEVMGCIVEHIGWQGYGGCGWYPGYGGGLAGGYGGGPFPSAFGQGQFGGAAGSGYAGSGYAPSTVTSGSNSGGWSGFGPLVDALYRGWDTALGRMLTEARELGADGVIGVDLRQHHMGEENEEFVALGTAVRSRGRIHLARPFSTGLAGQDVAKLMQRGWVPAAIVVAVSIGIRHDDWTTRQASSAWAGNTEVPGYTELVQDVRDDARRELARRTSQVGADGAILTQPMRLRIRELEVAEGHRDHVAEATVLSSTIASFHHADTGRPRTPGGLFDELAGMSMVLPLGGPRAR